MLPQVMGKPSIWLKFSLSILKLALDVLSDIILNSTFHDKEIEVERGVILQEIAMYQDMPDDVVSDLLRNISIRSTLGSKYFG